MSFIKVQEYFKEYNIEDRIIVFEHAKSATVSEAAEALHCEGARIAKTLSFKLKDGVLLVVAAGDARVDNSKFRECFNEKANMVKFDDVEELVGHAVGGVCPFAINDGVKVYLDESLKRFETVYPACGSDNSAIELSIPELEKYSKFTSWVNVCKDWE